VFTDDLKQSVQFLGESELLVKIRQWILPVSKPFPEGPGDDCAVIDTYPERKILVTTDGVVLNRHFTEATDPKAVGSKLVKRNLSDIAAMGGVPKNMVMATMLPANLSISWFEAFLKGAVEECLKYSVVLNGGDITQFPNNYFAAYVTLMGSADKVITRKGGKVGDLIVTTGALGGSIHGKHLSFSPRLREGQWLATRKEVKGMIDITDGLTKDLPELLPENTQARIDLSAIPLNDTATSLLSAFSDGEDYELLFTLDADCDWDNFYSDWKKQFTLPLTCIGKINTKAAQHPSALFINDLTNEPIEAAPGYQHLL